MVDHSDNQPGGEEVGEKPKKHEESLHADMKESMQGKISGVQTSSILENKNVNIPQPYLGNHIHVPQRILSKERGKRLVLANS